MVLQIIHTKDRHPYVKTNDEKGHYFYVLYEFLEGEEVDPEQDAEEILIGLYHFTMQMTIIEIFGIDCVDNEFLDRQLEWLYKWREQSGQNRMCSEKGVVLK